MYAETRPTRQQNYDLLRQFKIRADSGVPVGRGEEAEATVWIEGHFAEDDLIVNVEEVNTHKGDAAGQTLGEGNHFFQPSGTGKVFLAGGVGIGEGEALPGGGVEGAAMVGEALGIDVEQFYFAIEAVKLVVKQFGVRVAKVFHADDARWDVLVNWFVAAGVIAGGEPLLAGAHGGLAVQVGYVGDDQIPPAGVGGFENKFFGQCVPGDIFGAGVYPKQTVDVGFADLLAHVICYSEFIRQRSVLLWVVVELEPLQFFGEGLGMLQVEATAKGKKIAPGDIPAITYGDHFGNFS